MIAATGVFGPDMSPNPGHGRRTSALRGGFTLVEMLTVVAALVIVLGMMVRLAHWTRGQSAQTLTKDLLRRLDETMARHVAGHGGMIPAVTAYPPPDVVGTPPDTSAKLSAEDRRRLAEAAEANNRDLVKALQDVGGPVGRAGADRSLPEGLLSDLPPSVYDGTSLRDAWGSPVVFMPGKHPWVGTARRGRPYFFVSAGPDRDFLTRDDNLYSYEEVADPAIPTPAR